MKLEGLWLWKVFAEECERRGINVYESAEVEIEVNVLEDVDPYVIKFAITNEKEERKRH